MHDAVVDSEAVAETLAYLRSPEALVAIEADAYWPKWNSPWWRMALLHELGLTHAIPEHVVGALISALKAKYLHFFPLTRGELPEGVDPRRQVACHCQLGSIYQVLFGYGTDVDRELPWMRPWFLKYQLPDGGLNCDEKVYTRATPRSSVVSTLPVLEAVLHCTRRPFTVEEERFLDRGAQYLIDRRLCRSLSRGGEVINPEWLTPCFPRFYEYDVLRGLSFLTAWSERRGQDLPLTAISEVLAHLEAQVNAAGGEMPVGRQVWAGASSLRQDREGHWSGGMASSFPLLGEISQVGQASPPLTRQWSAVSAAASRCR